jgi:H+-translocating NAD(P) transhydrogenase subunit alpha
MAGGNGLTSDQDGPAAHLRVAVPTEVVPQETRVAAVPDTVRKMLEAGLDVLIQSGAGTLAHFPDDTYAAAGATLVAASEELYENADIVLKVRAPDQRELQEIRSGAVLIALLDPLRNHDLVARLAERDITALAMETIPRITRAQSMDALSSMSTIAGYKAVILGASTLGRLFPMLMTAAGTLAPAKVLVLGAGVAGLQALATARRLGAMTQAFDTRPVVREQVESVGASFIELPVTEEAEDEGGYAREMSEEFYRHEQDAIREHVAKADVVITTALIPGKPAPILITTEMVESMRPGSVIIDLASEAGGNCSLTEKDQRIEHAGVTVLGPSNLPATVPTHASQMYARNVVNLLLHLLKDAKLDLNMDDEIVRGACVTSRVTAAVG